MRLRSRWVFQLLACAWFAVGAGDRSTLEHRLQTLPTHSGPTRLVVGGERIELPGFQRYWRLELGRGTDVLVLDQQRGARSLVLKLSPDERLLGRLPVGAEIRSLLLCDLDWDGADELVIDSLEGWGTGLLDRRLRALQFESVLQELWQGCGDSVESSNGMDLEATVHVRCGRPVDREASGYELEVSRTIRSGSAVAMDGVRVALAGGRLRVTPLETTPVPPGKVALEPTLCTWKPQPPQRIR
jgi:hypothetical protein